MNEAIAELSKLTGQRAEFCRKNLKAIDILDSVGDELSVEKAKQAVREILEAELKAWHLAYELIRKSHAE